MNAENEALILLLQCIKAKQSMQRLDSLLKNGISLPWIYSRLRILIDGNYLIQVNDGDEECFELTQKGEALFRRKNKQLGNKGIYCYFSPFIGERCPQFSDLQIYIGLRDGEDVEPF